MPILNGTKYSKSELIHLLLDKKTRLKTLSLISNSRGVRLPKALLLDENSSMDYLKKPTEEQNLKELYNFSESFLHEMTIPVNKFKDMIGDLMSLSNSKLFSFLRNINILQNKSFKTSTKEPLLDKKLNILKIPENLEFEDSSQTVFYLSLLILNYFNDLSTRKNYEFKLLRLLQIYFKSMKYTRKSKEILSYVKIKFSKETIGSLIQSSICEIKECYIFLTVISCKLPENVLDIWFENDFLISTDIPRRLNNISLSNHITLNESIIEKFIGLKNFRKSIFNQFSNDNQLEVISEFANRPDFNFYRSECLKSKTNWRDSENVPAIMPRDGLEYSFFEDFNCISLFKSNIIKILRYLSIHNYGIIFDLFVQKNIHVLTNFIIEYGFSDLFPILEKMMQRIIEFNNIYHKDLNDTIFLSLKSNELFFRKIVRFFANPADETLYQLLIGNYEIDINHVKNYIKMGYEPELMAYFKTKPVSECFSVLDSWNEDFFLQLFSSYDLFNEQESLYLLSYLKRTLIHKANKNYICKIYFTVMKTDSFSVFQQLPERLKGMYLIMHQTHITSFLLGIDTAQATIYEATALFELGKNGIQLDFNQQETNFYNRIALNDYFDTKQPIQSLFDWSIIRKDDFKYFFVEFFDQILQETLNSFGKDDLRLIFDMRCQFETSRISESHDMNKIYDSLFNPDPFRYFDTKLGKFFYIFKSGFESRHNLFILFDKVINILSSDCSFSKIIALFFIDPTLLSKGQILYYLNVVVPLLNSSNYIICKLAKDSLNKIKLETKEIQNILPDIIQALDSSKTAAGTGNSSDSFEIFLNSFKSIVFNNYLCFNSINLILQLLFKYLKVFPKESLIILNRIGNLIKDKDLKYMSELIFKSMSKFVVNYNFYTKEALNVAEQYSLYVSFEDFSLLLKNIKYTRI